MSVLQYPDGFNAPDLQIWNNATFDHGESEPLAWASSNLDCVNLTLSLDSDDYSKENRRPDGQVGNSHVRLLDLNLNLPLDPDPVSPVSKGVKWKDSQEEKVHGGRERDIDVEIQEIEEEISRLSSRLKALHLEKAEQCCKTIERPLGRTVHAKFKEQKQGTRDSVDERKIDATLLSSMKPKTNRRGVSLGPAEIASAVKSRPLNKMEITPVLSVQNRRKSCFWKLQEIDELKVTKERRKSLSLTVSPTKTRKTVSKTQPQRQPWTTVGSKRGVKKEESAISSIQPKMLFKDGEKSAKKPTKPGRVVPSRYNQITISAARKRSFPENDKEEADRLDKRRASQGSATEVKAKKKWEIPREVVLYKSDEADEDKKKKKANESSTETPVLMVRNGEVLPKIRTGREFMNESPRDSGPAKRAAELVGRRNYFGSGEEDPVAAPFCQALSFIEDVEEE